MNHTSFISKVSIALVAFASLFTASKALSQEAFLGVNGYITTAYPYNQPTQGFFVQTVDYGSPAQFAGIMSRDVLLRSNGMPIKNYNDLATMRRTLGYNGVVHVTVLRNGAVFNLTVGGNGGGGGGGGIVPSSPGIGVPSAIPGVGSTQAPTGKKKNRR